MSPPKKTSIICVVQYNIEYLTKHSAKKKLETNDDNKSRFFCRTHSNLRQSKYTHMGKGN